MSVLTDLWRGRLGRIVILSTLAYVAIALCTDAPEMILVLNALAIAVSAGVCIVFAPLAYKALKAPTPSRVDILATGVWLLAISTLLVRVISVAVRDFGSPWIANTDSVTLAVHVGVLGSFLHLWAPFPSPGLATGRGRIVLVLLAVATGLLLLVILLARQWLGFPHPPIELR